MSQLMSDGALARHMVQVTDHRFTVDRDRRGNPQQATLNDAVLQLSLRAKVGLF